MQMDKHYPVAVGNEPPTVFVDACDYGGPHVSIERAEGGLVVLTLAEAQALIDVLRQAVAALGGDVGD